MPTAMTYGQVRAAMTAGAILVDGRRPEEFALGHLRGAINIGWRAAMRVRRIGHHPRGGHGAHDRAGRELEGKNRLARIGFDRVIGYLKDPYAVMVENQGEVDVASRLTTNALGERIADVPELQLVDVRNPGEGLPG